MDCLPYGARASMEPIGVGAAREDGAVVTFDGEVLEVSVVAQRRGRTNPVRVVFRHAFASDEMVLLNGYQSWTDAIERPAWSRMRGLRGVSRALIDRFALDGSGDYAFVDYSARRGRQHGFTYATFRRGEGVVLVGSLDESRGFTLISTDAAAGIVVLETEVPARILEAGERVVVGRYAVTRGTLDGAFDRYFELAGITARPARPLVGYTSWYRHYGDIDEAKLLGDLAATAPVPSATGFAPALRDADGAPPSAVPLALFQIDDGYCKVGDWLDPDAAKFPHGMKALADAARAAGFLPGLWVAPYLCEKDSRLFLEHRDWLLRDEAGELVRTGPHWSGGYALDTRNVDVRTYVLDVLRTMTSEWGFGLLKVDFLYAACMRPHDGMNRGELMADAMGLLRKGSGPDTLILGCGVPLGSAFGVVDYCRIGCDVGLDWDDHAYMRLLHRERVSTKNSLGNTRGRAPLDGRAFGNDPDVFFLRDDVRLSQAHRDELLFADAEGGSVLLTSDDMGSWTEAMRARYEEALRVFLARHRESGRRS